MRSPPLNADHAPNITENHLTYELDPLTSGLHSYTVTDFNMCVAAYFMLNISIKMLH